MYEDRTQNYDPEIREEYLMTRPFPCHIIYSHVQSADYGIAINTTNSTERQQFSAVTVSLKSGFKKSFSI